MTEAIITEATEKGELRKICADPNCPVHHPKKQKPTADANWKAEQEKQRREEALAQATGLRVLNAIIAAVPVRLMKRDLLFIVERVAAMLDERRLEVIARNRGIKKEKESDSIPKLLRAQTPRRVSGGTQSLRFEAPRRAPLPAIGRLAAAAPPSAARFDRRVPETRGGQVSADGAVSGSAPCGGADRAGADAAPISH